MEWDPTQYFNTTVSPPPFALLILNQQINNRAFTALHQHANFTLCADGGANKYFDLMKRYGQESTNLPDAIVGDLDSIKPEVRKHYAKLGVLIVKDEDQYSTDFTKCLRFLRARSGDISRGSSHHDNLPDVPADTRKEVDVLVLGGLGGRVDQAFSQIHHLYLVSAAQGEGREENAPGNLYLVSEESITFVLRKGRNVVRTPGWWTSRSQREPLTALEPSQSEYLEENVGIIPVTGPTRISTQGFQWDVQDWTTSVGGNLSTSNHIRAGKVVVECEDAVLFTLELAEWLKVGRG